MFNLLALLSPAYQKHCRLLPAAAAVIALPNAAAARRGRGRGGCLSEDGEEDAGEEDLVRLARRDELGDDAVDDVRRREEVDEDARQDVAEQPRLEGARAPHAVEQDGDLEKSRCERSRDQVLSDTM